ncbi:MAG TPA: hypothetical protein VNM47_09975 [Terriglobia bacterium]|nr:hypothetical protein [Terriglobia bacterium]
MKILPLWLALMAVICLGPNAAGLAQSEPAPPKPAAVYFSAYRTPRHMKYSKPEVFHQAVADVVEYLEAHRVRIAEDPIRKRIETSDLIPVATLVNIARDAGASSVLLLTVDRPLTKWVKIDLEAYDLSGKLLWKESVAEGGGLRGKGGVEKAMGKLKASLEPRLGQAGLEQTPVSEEKSAPLPAGKTSPGL